MRLIHRAAIAALGVAALSLSACGSSGSGAATTQTTGVGNGATGSSTALDKSPIMIGAVSSISGTPSFPEIPAAMQAYVAALNRKGGINGHPIVLKVVDGGASPSALASAGRQLADDNQVVAMVNSAQSDCSTNGPTYAQANVAAVEYLFQTSCYAQSNLFPITSSSNDQINTSAKWAVEQGAKRIAFITADLPGNVEIPATLEAYLSTTDARLVMSKVIPTDASASTFDQIMSQAKADKIDTVIALLLPPSSAIAFQEAVKYGLGPANGVRWVTPGSNYDPSLVTTLGSAANGSWVQCYTWCWQTDEAEVQNVYNILKSAHVSPIDGLVGMGIEGIELLKDRISTIKGDITRASVLQAMRSTTHQKLLLSPDEVTYTQTPTSSNPRPPSGGLQMIKIEHGQFVDPSQWITPVVSS
jgi:ABC-type branched-subunit amino acid transport system substrate-binding protein